MVVIEWYSGFGNVLNVVDLKFFIQILFDFIFIGGLFFRRLVGYLCLDILNYQRKKYLKFLEKMKNIFKNSNKMIF